MNSPSTEPTPAKIDPNIVLANAKLGLGKILPEPMASWSYDQLLAALAADIDKIAKLAHADRPNRHYARHCLDIKGNEEHKVVGAWRRREKIMTFEDMKLVMWTLLDHRTEAVAKPQPIKTAPATPDVNRQAPAACAAIDMTITMLNALVVLTSSSPGLSETVHNGHRIAIATALIRLTQVFGIAAKFPETSTTQQAEPVTKGDLKKIGL